MSVLTFGPFRLDQERRRLTREGAAVPVKGRALDILMLLAAHTGAIVPKQRIIEAVWHGQLVEENNLAVHISALRRALGTSDDGRSVIQTVARRGYMLLYAPVAETPTDQDGVPASVTASTRTVRPRAATTFVGRAKERVATASLFASHRMVTITAPGGMGKTRLALEVAQDVAGTVRDGVVVFERLKTALETAFLPAERTRFVHQGAAWDEARAAFEAAAALPTRLADHAVPKSGHGCLTV